MSVEKLDGNRRLVTSPTPSKGATQCVDQYGFLFVYTTHKYLVRVITKDKLSFSVAPNPTTLRPS